MESNYDECFEREMRPTTRGDEDTVELGCQCKVYKEEAVARARLNFQTC